jgi:uroporphyrinogen decarboxylase
MDSLQRVLNTFSGQPVDRLPAGEDFWGETLAKWQNEGHLNDGENPVEHFGLDLDRAGLINSYADPSLGWRVLEEDDATTLLIDPNGVITRTYKKRAGGVDHVACHVQDRATWDSFAKPHLEQLNPARIPFDAYAKARAACLVKSRHFSSDAFGPFEMMHRLVGHENLLVAMALDPEWVKDMVRTYCEFNVRHWAELFGREGVPHATWIADDLGYKFKPFMSVTMFEEILLPGYVRMFDWLHERGLKVILHSCGYVEPFLPLLIDAGLDCLEGMEAKAGMDQPSLFRTLGDRVVWFGNMDIRVLESNDRARIDEEIEVKLRSVTRRGGRCMLHSDHSISPLVQYDTYRYFLERGTAL